MALTSSSTVILLQNQIT